MKKIVFLALISASLCASAQTGTQQPTRRGNMESRALVDALSQCKGGDAIPQRLLRLFPIRQLNGVATIGVLAKVDDAYDAAALQRAGIRQGSRVADIVSLRMPLSALPLMETLPGIVTYSVEHHISPMLDDVRFDTRTDQVQAGEGGLPQPFDGTGVLAGITDWGFDYNHLNFNKGEHRIERAWDQFRTAGPAPAGFDYGTEIVGYEALKAAEGDTCHYDWMSDPADPNDNRPHLLINVDRMDGYTLHLWVTAEAGARVDAWNLANLANHAGNWGADFTNNRLQGYSSGNTAYGIGEPGCARRNITVAAHAADHMNDTTYVAGEIALFSSHGPAYGDYEKPDISAPGVRVVSSISGRTTDDITPTFTVLSGGKPQNWAPMSGTSMSSPAVTGIVALMLQANPHLTADQIKEIISATARNDHRTGDLVATRTHSDIWGWGKIDALAAVTAAYDRLDIDEAQRTLPRLCLHPNPAQGYFVAVTSTERPETLTLFAMDGRRVMERTVTNGARIDVSALPQGLYVVRTTSVLGTRTAKLAIQ